MGFLDSILKIVKEKVTEAVEDAVNTQSSETSTQVNTVKKFEQKVNPSTDENYFAGLLTEENFPGYTIERSVKLDTFDASAHPKCFPITFLFKKNGAPVLAVFIFAKISSRQYDRIGKNSHFRLQEHTASGVGVFAECELHQW